MTESRSELAHTPLPWQCATKFSSGLGVPVLNNQGQRVCNTGDAAWKADDKEYQGRALANAAFIVRAVNSHDALVKLAKQVAAEFADAKHPHSVEGRLCIIANQILDSLAQSKAVQS